jgi:hypothetical protein
VPVAAPVRGVVAGRARLRGQPPDNALPPARPSTWDRPTRDDRLSSAELSVGRDPAGCPQAWSFRAKASWRSASSPMPRATGCRWTSSAEPGLLRPRSILGPPLQPRDRPPHGGHGGLGHLGCRHPLPAMSCISWNSDACTRPEHAGTPHPASLRNSVGTHGRLGIVSGGHNRRSSQAACCANVLFA